jgi:hypothetical protein
MQLDFMSQINSMADDCAFELEATGELRIDVEQIR